jgi:TPR repeat protein
MITAEMIAPQRGVDARPPGLLIGHGDATDNILVSPIMDTTYTLEASSAKGPTATQTVTVHVTMPAFDDCYRLETVQHQYQNALACYEPLAAKGDAKSMASLGNLYENGLGVAVNYQLAQQWYVRAIQAGDVNALTNLGYMYESGHLLRNYATAIGYYTKAAAMGEPRAMYRLGLAYENGTGVTKDLNQAEAWYRKAVAASPAGYTEPRQALDRLTGSKK